MTRLGLHGVEESRPRFLDLLDGDSVAAFSQFHQFTWGFLCAHPPTNLRRIKQDYREDLISDLILHCWADNQRVLRSYPGSGVPFAYWFLSLANRRARAYQWGQDRNLARTVEDPDGAICDELPAHPNYDQLEALALSELLYACLDHLSPHCRLMLESKAERYTHLQLDRLLGLPEQWRQTHRTRLHRCRAELRRLLEKKGYRIGRRRARKDSAPETDPDTDLGIDSETDPATDPDTDAAGRPEEE